MDEAAIADRFRAQFREDLAVDGPRPLAAYQRLFAGHEELIAREYDAMFASAEGETVLSERPPTPAPANGPNDPDTIDTLAGDTGLPHPDEVPTIASGGPAGREAPTVVSAPGSRRGGSPRDPSRTGIPGLLDAGQDRFRDDGEIARGGMGAIVRLWDDALDRQLAKKLILPAGAGRPDLVERFVEEARVTAQLSHPGVVPVHDVGLDEFGRLFFTMKLVAGRTFTDVIREVHDPANEQWTLQRAVQTFLRVCETMAFAHDSGVIHRDLKPDNVMVGGFGEVYVMDWGLAKVLERGEPARGDAAIGAGSAAAISGSRSDRTMAGSIMGTPTYMPPEQAAGRVDDLDARADIYSLGAILYELLSGVAPYDDGDERLGAMQIVEAVIAGPPTQLAELTEDLPGELLAIAEKAMSRHTAGRYPSATELRRDLEDFLEGRVVRAYRTGPLVELKKWVQRNKAVAATAAVGAVVAAGLAVAFFQYSVGVEQEQTRIAKEHTAEVQQEQERTAEALLDARALGLVSESVLQAEVEPTLSLLLAKSAVETRRRPETLSRLQSALIEFQERTVLLGHTAQVLGVAFSPDGRRLVSGARDGTARIWTTEGDQLAVLRGHDRGLIPHAAFTPDGEHVVTGGFDGTARLWTLAGVELHRFGGHGDSIDDTYPSSARRMRGSVETISISPDGRYLLTDSWEHVARLFDLESGELATTFVGHAGAVNETTFSPDGKLVLTGSTDATARIWNLEGKEQLRLETGGTPILAVAWSPDGRYVAAGQSNGETRIWHADGRPVSVLEGHTSRVLDVSFSADGEGVVTTSADRTARTFEVGGKALGVLRGHGLQVSGAVFHPGGHHVISWSQDRTARVWTIRGRPLAVLRGHRRSCTAALSSDGALVATISDEPRIRIWETLAHQDDVLDAPSAKLWSTNALAPDGSLLAAEGNHAEHDQIVALFDPSGRQVARTGTHPGPIQSLAWSSDSSLVAAGTAADGEIRVWDTDGRLVSSLRHVRLPGRDEGIDQFVTWLEWAPDGETMLSAGGGLVHLWNRAGEVLTTFGSAERQALCGRFSPDGRYVLTFSDDGSLHLCTPTGDVIREFQGTPARVRWAEWTPDGTRFLSTSHDDSARLWSVDGGLVDDFADRPAPYGRVQFSPDGERLQSGLFTTLWHPGRGGDTPERVAHLWTGDGEWIRKLDDHSDISSGFGFSMDGTRVVTASADGTTCVYDRDGTLLQTLDGRAGFVDGAHIAPDASYIFTAGRGEYRVWHLDPDVILERAAERLSRDYSDDELERYADLLGR